MPLGLRPTISSSAPFGDELKIADRNITRVIGISMKDRAAILPAGRMADAAYWIDDTIGAFVSSTWCQAALPSWVASFNEGKPAQCFLDRSWFGPGAEQKGDKPFETLPAESGKGYIATFRDNAVVQRNARGVRGTGDPA